MTLGSGGRCPEARSVPQGPAVSLFRMRLAKVAVGSFQSYFSKGFRKQRMRRLCAAAAGRQLDFLVGLPGGPVRPSGPCCFAVSHAPGKGGSRQLPELLF